MIFYDFSIIYSEWEVQKKKKKKKKALRMWLSDDNFNENWNQKKQRLYIIRNKIIYILYIYKIILFIMSKKKKRKIKKKCT